MLVSQLEQLRRQYGRGKETQKEEPTDGEVFHILFKLKWVSKKILWTENDFPEDLSQFLGVGLDTDLILRLCELFLHSLVQLFEGHSHDWRTLIDRADDGFDDAG